MANDTLGKDSNDSKGAHGSIWLPIMEGRFRERRFYLVPDAFADPDEDIDAPIDLIDQSQWVLLMDLPTDGSLQSTDHFGSRFRAMGSLSYMWISGIVPPDPRIQQAFWWSLTPALTSMTSSKPVLSSLTTAGTAKEPPACEMRLRRWPVRGDPAGYSDWRTGVVDPKFGNSLEPSAGSSSVAGIDSSFSRDSLFGPRPDGVLRNLYRVLCHFSNDDPGHTSSDFWEGSNGPIFSGEAFKRYWGEFRDAFIDCCILLKIADPATGRPVDLAQVVEHAIPVLVGIATEAVGAYFS